MPSLFHTLNIGSESLYATRQGVDTAGHNIANAQVKGFSRQRINLVQRDPLQKGSLLIGNGNYVGSISRLHDKFIENQINRAQQDAGLATAKSDAMKQLEVIFSPELNASVADEMSEFFNRMQDLSNFPEDFTVRTSVVESGKNIAAAFRRIDSSLKQNRTDLNERIGEQAAKLTDNLAEIAALNVKIQIQEAGQKQDANDLRDQRDRLVQEVTGTIDCHYYEDKFGMLCLRGPSEVTLVDGGNASRVELARNADNSGMYDIMITDWEGHRSRDVTQKLEGGSMAAYVNMRDAVVPALIDKNNESAFTFANEFNGVHSQGFGLKGYAESRGRDFFVIGDDVDAAASRIDLTDSITESVDAISAGMSPSAPGDNVNLLQILKLKDMRLYGDDNDATFTEFYANYVGTLGLDVLRADHIREANDVVMQDLSARRESVSGVSLDEEATNLLKWQSNFTASSKLITTVDEMLETVLSLKR